MEKESRVVNRIQERDGPIKIFYPNLPFCTITELPGQVISHSSGFVQNFGEDIESCEKNTAVFHFCKALYGLDAGAKIPLPRYERHGSK